MECLGRYTFLVMTSVILSGGVKMRDEHGMLREVYIFVMTSVILSGGMKMSVGHGMLREVYISCHDFQPDRYILLVPKLYNVSRGVVE